MTSSGEYLRYDLFSPRKIVFGWGRRAEVGQLAATLGRRALIVVGSRTLERQGTVDELMAALKNAGITSIVMGSVTREPEVSDIDGLVAQALADGVREGDLVIGIGGGAALDAAKALSAMLTNRQGASVADFLEGVGRGLTIDTPPLPLMAIPTTAGTGTEATKNAVISSYDPLFKKSLRSEEMVPRVALVDAELTVSCPRDITAQSGMDAITQLIESLISCRATPLTRALCREGLVRALPAIERAVREPGGRPAREVMSHAALLSGIALANSGLGMAHGVAAALGVHCRVAHGLACTVMLPVALEVNHKVCRDDLLAIGRMCDPPASSVAQTIDAIRKLNERIGIPSHLRALGVTADQIPAIVQSSRGNSMSGNPREIADEELTAILTSAL